jgi:hypothetical protein
MYQPTAINHSEASENKIHSDEIAARYGFKGGLVPGVAVFGYMTYPLTNELGLDWLGHSQVGVRLLKPAYDGERLNILMTQPTPEQYQVDALNDEEVLLARLSIEMPGLLPPIEPRARIAGATTAPERVDISWDVIDIDQPFVPISWAVTEADNHTYTDQVADDQPVYRAGVVHPHFIQHWCNQVLSRRFIMPAWIHVGTDMTFRRTLKVGDQVEIRAIPTEKWERKGHEFVKVYVAFMVDGEPAVEANHTAIFKVAERG